VATCGERGQLRRHAELGLCAPCCQRVNGQRTDELTPVNVAAAGVLGAVEGTETIGVLPDGGHR
jgi:hypothetical protein